MKFFWFSVLALMLSFGSARATSLHGTVKDAETQAPIAGASLTLHILLPDSTAIPMSSDAAGTYGVDAIPSGNQIYVVVASAVGYLGYYVKLDALDGSDLLFDVTLVREPPAPPPPTEDSSTVRGIVMGSTGPSGGLSPVENARVSLTSGGAHSLLYTDGDGRYSTRVPIGSYALSVEALGYQTLGAGGVTCVAEGMVLDAVLRAAPVPARPASWARVRSIYR